MFNEKYVIQALLNLLQQTSPILINFKYNLNILNLMKLWTIGF